MSQKNSRDHLRDVRDISMKKTRAWPLSSADERRPKMGYFYSVGPDRVGFPWYVGRVNANGGVRWTNGFSDKRGIILLSDGSQVI